MLRQYCGGQFDNLGHHEEISYWKALGGVGNTITDTMVSYLSSQGYSGTPYDMLNGWLQAQKGKGFIGDNARALAGYK